jgi:hypothetical protein
MKVALDLMPAPEIPTKQLLEVSQKTRTYDLIVQSAITFGSFFKWTLMARKVTAEQFLDELAEVTEKTLQKAGYYK